MRRSASWARDEANLFIHMHIQSTDHVSGPIQTASNGETVGKNQVSLNPLNMTLCRNTCAWVTWLCTLPLVWPRTHELNVILLRVQLLFLKSFKRVVRGARRAGMLRASDTRRPALEALPNLSLNVSDALRATRAEWSGTMCHCLVHLRRVTKSPIFTGIFLYPNVYYDL